MDSVDIEAGYEGTLTIYNDGLPIGTKAAGEEKKKRKNSIFKNSLKSGKIYQSLVPVFDLLPHELVVRIHSFFDAPTAFRAARVSRRFNAISHDTGLWHEISSIGKWSKLERSPELTRKDYVQEYKSFLQQVKRQRNTERKNERARQRLRCIDRAGVALLALLFARPYEWLSMFCCILFTVFLILKLDQVVSWSWPVVFLPALVVLYQMLFTPVIFDVLRSTLNHDFEQEFDPERLMRPIFFFVFFLVPLRTRKNLNRFLLYTPAVLVPLFVALLLLRITGTSVMSWWLVFLPCLVLCAHLSMAPLVIHAYVWHDEYWFDRVMCSLGGVVLMMFFFLLIPKLEYGMNLSWWAVMSPLFILNAAALFVPVFYNILLFCVSRRWVEDNSRWANDPVAYNITAVFVLLLVAVPLLVFEVLLAGKFEGTNIPFKLAFVPVLILEGFTFCACVGMDLVMVL